MEEIKDILESRGVKPTFQRITLLKYLHDHKTHPTVDRLYNFLVKIMPTISKTTIYNTLDLFVKNGLAKQILISPTEVRYDGDMSFHNHFFCEKCNNIIDVFVESQQKSSGEIHGHKINEVHGYYTGICHECQ